MFITANVKHTKCFARTSKNKQRKEKIKMFYTTELNEYVSFFCEYKGATDNKGSRFLVKNSENKTLFTFYYDYSGKNRDKIAAEIEKRYPINVNSCSDYMKGFVLLGQYRYRKQ